MSWESPINIVEQAIQTNINHDIENMVVAEVERTVCVQVDKESLLKALNYSHDSYEKGYAEGSENTYHKYKKIILTLYTDLLEVIKDKDSLKKIDSVFDKPLEELNENRCFNSST